MSSTIDPRGFTDAPGVDADATRQNPIHHVSGTAQQGARQVLVLPDSADAVQLTRSWLASDVGLPPDLAEDAILLTSELVSNAVRHGRPEVEVSVHVTPPSVHVAVADRADSRPLFPDEPHGMTNRSGGGLYLVASMATGWGFQHHYPGPGKTVWFTLYGLNRRT